MRFVSSLSSSKRMRSPAHRACETIVFWNGSHPHLFCMTQQNKSERDGWLLIYFFYFDNVHRPTVCSLCINYKYQNLESIAAASQLDKSERRRWIEAVWSDIYMAWKKRYRWRSWYSLSGTNPQTFNCISPLMAVQYTITGFTTYYVGPILI